MKKPSVFSFLITLLLAAAVCTQGKERVNDSSGNPLEAGQQYFIQPVKTVTNKGGGLVPAGITLAICPLGIVQSLISSQPGLPVIFKFPFPNPEAFVDTSVDVNIVFMSNDFWLCNKFSKLWAVDTSPSAREEPDILIAGVTGSQNSSFKIEKAGEGAGKNTYKLTSLDRTVGFKPSIWGRQLGLTNDAAKTLLVKFKKFDDASTATAASSTSRVEKLGLRMFPFY